MVPGDECLSIASQNLHFLAQGLELVHTLDDGQYAAAEANRSSVGAHLRHVIDCYRCFLRGLERGEIDYDARQRDPRLETERSVAESVLHELIDAFEALGDETCGRPLRVKVDAAAWCDDDPWHGSTVGRELQFLLSHTVHHYALIALLLRTRGVEPDPSFGVAPSTLEHQGLEHQGVAGPPQGAPVGAG